MKYQTWFGVTTIVLSSILLTACDSKVKRDFKAGCQAVG
jgi:hypothetical protein